ncbi:MAG TPA: TIGR00730 family Rossman fold protein [Polyangiaceae bacterium]|nr:TIGR00730 family Rossman fold protein [Polyangiaceae bacterium]
MNAAGRAPLESLCVFCGSQSGHEPKFAAAARTLGALLAERQTTLIYGGGHAGLMGALADAALAGGGRVVGVIPTGLVERELAHPGLTERHVVSSMHERKALMARLARAFLALPGGLGTLDELFEIWTWAQLRFHSKPIGLLNVDGFFEPLLELTRRIVGAGFARPESLELVLVDDDPERVLARLSAKVELAAQP